VMALGIRAQSSLSKTSGFAPSEGSLIGHIDIDAYGELHIEMDIKIKSFDEGNILYIGNSVGDSTAILLQNNYFHVWSLGGTVSGGVPGDGLVLYRWYHLTVDLTTSSFSAALDGNEAWQIDVASIPHPQYEQVPVYASAPSDSPLTLGVAANVRVRNLLIESNPDELTWFGWQNPTAPMSECEGDCDNNGDCGTDLYCYHDAGLNGVPPGCTGTSFSDDADYCFRVPPSTGKLQWFSWKQTGGLNECQGDCDNDGHCSDGLKCYHNGVPPGCSGTLHSDGADYCYDPTSGNSAADGFASGHSDDEPLEDVEPDHVASDGETAFFDDFVPIILGAAAGATAIAVIVAAVVAMRKRHSAKGSELEMADAVHVDDVSVTTNTERESGVDAVTVHSSDAASATVSVSMDAVQVTANEC